MQESVLTGRWWRAKHYELRDGYLRPAGGAAFRSYEPLDDHDFLRRSRRSDFLPAYLRLARIVDMAVSGETREQEILAWCGEYGLLGVLLHQVLQVRFAPRWQPRRTLSAEAKRRLAPIARAARAARLPDGTAIKWEDVSDPSRLLLTQTLYQRTSYGTFLWGDQQHVVPAVPLRDARPGDLASRETWRLSAPEVIIQHLATREWSHEPLSSTWGCFFPDVPEPDRETYAYPMPYSAEFWAAYAEPIEEFLIAARFLRDAFMAASGKRLRRGRPRSSDLEPRPGPSMLNALVAPAGPILVGSRSTYEQRLVAPSLLGSLALMAQLDLAGHRRFLRCRNSRCSKLFVGNTAQSTYCSTECRQAHYARRSGRGPASD